MKVSELITALHRYPQSTEIVINYRISTGYNYTEQWKSVNAVSEIRRIDPEKISIQIVGQDDLGYVCGKQGSHIYKDHKWDKGNNIVESIPEGNWTNTAEVVVIDMIDTPTQLDYNGTR